MALESGKRGTGHPGSDEAPPDALRASGGENATSRGFLAVAKEHVVIMPGDLVHGPGVQGGQLAPLLHDVDLAGLRPSDCRALRTEEPEGGPEPLPRRHLDERLPPGEDHQVPRPVEQDIGRPIAVVFELAVPQVRSQVELPVRRVRQPTGRADDLVLSHRLVPLRFGRAGTGIGGQRGEARR